MGMPLRVTLCHPRSINGPRDEDKNGATDQTQIQEEETHTEKYTQRF